MKKSAIDLFLAARAVGAPLINYVTPDSEVTIKKIQRVIAEKARDKPGFDGPIIQWDCIRGWVGRNNLGSHAITATLKRADVEIDATKNPVRMMVLAEHLPANTILFILGAHHRTHQMETATFWQALWNLRDLYKGNFRAAVLLSPSITLPIDISGDVLSIEEGLPDMGELEEIVQDITALIPEASYTKANKQSAAKALIGLTPFAAEQAVALALTPSQISVPTILDRKRELLNEIPGLKVYMGQEKFPDLGGCDEIKKVLTRILKGKDAPKVIVFIDEGEKAMAGATHSVGDNTGVSQDFMGTLLTFMEDFESDGVIFVGPTGTAKSALAKAMGNEASVPTVFLDLGGMKNSLLGASEHRLRYALQTIEALGQGNVFFIMTSNNISKIPPEFKRRFASGTFFFDLPSAAEQAKIWSIHTKKYQIPASQVAEVESKGWTGAEIRNCCRMAYRQNISLKEASAYIVPVAQSGAEAIAQLRDHAKDNFLSANYPGVYQGAVDG